MEIKDIRSKAHNLSRDSRNLSRLVDSSVFVRAWELATLGQRIELYNLVLAVKKSDVERVVKCILSASSLADKSVRELRGMARAAGVPYYHHRTKEELIEELKS